MAVTHFHPTAAFIVGRGKDVNPGALSSEEKIYLRELAKRVAEISAKPIQQIRKKLWTDHNALKQTRPLYALYAEAGWEDLLAFEDMCIKSDMWKDCEWYLRHLIFRDEFIDDDFVIEPVMFSFVDHYIENAEFGLTYTGRSSPESGAWVADPALKSFDDIDKLLMPELVINQESTEARYEAMQEVFGDILSVEHYLASNFQANQPGQAARMRGIEPMLLDMYDEPDGLHALMRFLTDACISLFKQMQDSGYLRLNNRNHYVDSGGNGYNEELTGSQGQPASLKQLWGFGVAQEFSEVSPQMHEEFGVAYQKEVLDLFGLSSYGCCEPYTNKFDILKQIGNLRRVSVSPWCDTRKAAEKLENKYIYSFKPNPSILLYKEEMEEIRSYIQNALDVAKDCCVELFLKDIIHLNGVSGRIPELGHLIRDMVGN